MTNSPEMQILSRQFAFDDGFLDVITEGFEPEHWTRRAEGVANSALWIVGHLAMCRRYLARMAGTDLSKDDWESLFNMGADADLPEHAPDHEALVAHYKSAGAILVEALAGLSPEDAAQEIEAHFPDGANTLAAGARYLHFHEAYHLGQLGLLRRLCGLPRFA